VRFGSPSVRAEVGFVRVVSGAFLAEPLFIGYSSEGAFSCPGDRLVKGYKLNLIFDLVSSVAARLLCLA